MRVSISKTKTAAARAAVCFLLNDYWAAVSAAVSLALSLLSPVHAPRKRELRAAKITYFIVFSFEVLTIFLR